MACRGGNEGKLMRKIPKRVRNQLCHEVLMTTDGRFVWILPSNDHQRLIHVQDDVEVARI